MVTEALSIVMVSLGILATTLVILPAVWGKYKTLRGEVAVAAWRSGTKLALPAMSFIIFTIYAFLLPYSLKGIEDAQWLLSYFEILQRFIVVGFMLILLYILGRRLWSARRTRRKSNSLKKEGVLNPQLDSARKVLISTVSLGCCSLATLSCLLAMLQSVPLALGMEVDSAGSEVLSQGILIYSSALLLAISLLTYALVFVIEVSVYETEVEEE